MVQRRPANAPARPLEGIAISNALGNARDDVGSGLQRLEVPRSGARVIAVCRVSMSLAVHEGRRRADTARSATLAGCCKVALRPLPMCIGLQERLGQRDAAPTRRPILGRQLRIRSQVGDDLPDHRALQGGRDDLVSPRPQFGQCSSLRSKTRLSNLAQPYRMASCKLALQQSPVVAGCRYPRAAAWRHAAWAEAHELWRRRRPVASTRARS